MRATQLKQKSTRMYCGRRRNPHFHFHLHTFKVATRYSQVSRAENISISSTSSVQGSQQGPRLEKRLARWLGGHGASACGAHNLQLVVAGCELTGCRRRPTLLRRFDQLTCPYRSDCNRLLFCTLGVRFTSCVSAKLNTWVHARSSSQTTARFHNGVLRNLHSGSPRCDKRSKAGVELVEAWSRLGAEQE